MQDFQTRARIHPKQYVRIRVKIQGEYTGEAQGRVAEILTNTDVHARGIKVRLEDGTVGRVCEILKTPKKQKD